MMKINFTNVLTTNHLLFDGSSHLFKSHNKKRDQIDLISTSNFFMISVTGRVVSVGS
jgi:hypothetical protein